MRLITMLAACVALALAGCGGGDDSSSSSGGGGSSSGGTVTIDLKNIQFAPKDATVKVGQTVKWVNQDTQARSVVSDDGRSFSSPAIAPGASWTYQANTPGTFAYHDGTRPYAVATLEVVHR